MGAELKISFFWIRSNLLMHTFSFSVCILAPVISEMFNMNIIEGIFPICLKTGRTIRIFISGRNYPTLPVLRRNVDKLAHKRMLCFISRFNLLITNQFGLFRRTKHIWGSSSFLNKVYDVINQNRVLLKVFIELSKALIQSIMEIFWKNCITMASELKIWTGSALF